jgi:hypothetical protein
MLPNGGGRWNAGQSSGLNIKIFAVFLESRIEKISFSITFLQFLRGGGSFMVFTRCNA